MRKLKVLTLTLLFVIISLVLTHIIIYIYFVEAPIFDINNMSSKHKVGHLMMGILAFFIAAKSIHDDFLFIDSIEKRGKSIKGFKSIFK